MKRFVILAALAGFAVASEARAQVFVRAPFVRVWVDGPNVQVRAPFVNIGTRGYGPVFGPVYGGPIYGGPVNGVNGPVYVIPPKVIGPDTPPSEFLPPPPKEVPGKEPPKPNPDKGNPDLEPPQPVEPATAPTMSDFAKSFQAKPGSYEVTILNPITKAPTPVRFTLPEGTPRRIHVRRNEIEFDYGPRRFVRIEFDKDGAQVVSR